MGKVVDGSMPDLEFYYNVDDIINSTTYNDVNINNTISQNFIYLESDLKTPIGSYIFDYLIGNNNNEAVATFNIAFNNYPTLNGGFQCSNINNTSSSIYIDPNSDIIYNIYSGSGTFLLATGYMVIITNDTPIRQCLVYLAK